MQMISWSGQHVSGGESLWVQVIELESLISHFSVITKKLQSEDLTPSKILEWKLDVSLEQK